MALIDGIGSKLLISDGVREFNKSQQRDAIGKTQPPLTDDELFDALRSHFPKLRQTIDAGYMPIVVDIEFELSESEIQRIT